MNTTRYAALALAFVAGGATPLYAQSFTGPRVEALIGWDQLRFDLADYARTGRAKRSDLGYGAAIGYDKALAPRLIAGVEVAAQFSDGDYNIGGALNGGTLRERRDLSVAARIGTPLSANALLYGKIGYANLQTGDTLRVAGVDSYDRRNLDGVLLGVGAEVAITPLVYLKSEYRYTNYEKGLQKNDVLTGIGLRF